MPNLKHQHYMVRLSDVMSRLHSTKKIPPIIICFFVQAVAATITFAGILLFNISVDTMLSATLVLSMYGIIAVACGVMLRLPTWWIPINLLFIPAIVVAQSLSISSYWYLCAFLMLTLIYWSTYRTRVPLYLSNRKARDALLSVLPTDRAFNFLDLGCGFAGLLNYLTRAHKTANYYGIESAPLPYFISKIRSYLSRRSFEITWGNFWEHNLAPYDVVYAYLSPVAMPGLWDKAYKEMRSGTLLISNCFAIPGVKPTFCIELDGDGGRQLYVWRV